MEGCQIACVAHCHRFISLSAVFFSFPPPSRFETVSRCPARDIAVPGINCSYPGLIRALNLSFFFFFSPRIPVPDVCALYLTSGRRDTGRDGQGTVLPSPAATPPSLHQPKKSRRGDRRNSTRTSCKRRLSHTSGSTLFFQNSARSSSLHQRVIRGEIRVPRLGSLG